MPLSIKRRFFIKRALTGLSVFLCVYTLNALEISKQTENRYLGEIDVYEKRLKNHGALEIIKTIPRTMPFTTSQNTQLIEINNDIYQNFNFEHPCPEKTHNIKAPPPIELKAESHYCPNCNVEFAKTIIESRNGKNILAMEGIPFEYKKPVENAERGYIPSLLSNLPASGQSAYGIDIPNISIADVIEVSQTLNEISQSITPAERVEPMELDPQSIEKGPNNRESYLTQIIYQFIKNTLINDEYSSAMESFYVKEPELKSRIQELAKTLQKLEKTITNENELIASSMKSMNSTLNFEILQKLAKNILNEKISFFALQNQDTLPHLLISFLSNKKNNFNDPDNLEILDDIFTVTLRNIDFAQNIANLYCEKSLENGKPLVVYLGASHAEAQKFLLEKIFPFNKASPSIKITNIAVKYATMPIKERKAKLSKDLQEMRRTQK